MCGRYTLSTPAGLIQDHFDLPEIPALTDRYNIAPSQESLIIGARRDGSRAAGMGRWGLTPPPGMTKARPMINARIETVDRRPAFREAFERRRCLVLADGFYEWRREPGGKVPCYFSLRNGDPFAFAGIWSRSATGDLAVTYAILTTQPNPLVRPIHQRMPVILDTGSCDVWLEQRTLTSAETGRIAQPYPENAMQWWEVSPLVNSPANDTAACISPADIS